ncbi:MAG TPA: hypothetical protein VFO52_12055 [Longimicrobiales bacterium]|nr:hypothetical protein [Longimicrobiales bacterium]
MSLKRMFWLPVALGLVVLNLAGGIFAYLTSEPMHGFVHGAAAVGFGLWAHYLWQSPAAGERQIAQPDKVKMLEADLSELERELKETQERLDFADQLLKKKQPPTS